MIKKLCWIALGQSLLWTPFWGSPILLVSPAAAYTTQESLTVYWLAGEDYTALARRAELAARTAAQRQFDTDILLTRVVITVLGQNGGQAAPILTLDVGRNNWRSRPDPRYWSKYYRSAPALLGLKGVAPTGVLQTSPAVTAPIAPVPIQPASGAPNGVPGNSPESTPESAPRSPGQNPGSSTIQSPDQPADQPMGSGAAPVINLPAVPAGVGIPAILR